MTAPSLTLSPASQLSFAGGALLIRVLSSSPAVVLQTGVLKNDQMSSKPHGYLMLNTALPRHQGRFFHTFLFPHSPLRAFCCPTGSPIPRLPGTTEVGMSPVRSTQPRDQLAQTFVVTATVSTSLLACATALVYRIKRDNVVGHG